MPSERDFPARGKVIKVLDDSIVFAPSGFNYELRLNTASRYDGPVNELIEGFVRVNARKLYTVPSGGNFIAPIFGPPRIVQGRVRDLTEQGMVLQAGCPIIVTFPKEDNAFDLGTGTIAIGKMVNVTVFPGATFELLGVAALK